MTAANKWLITLTVMLVAIMEVLDITIVNVSLRDMMGTFGATISQITWVITAYVVASAVLMPLTGFLTQIIGQRKLLLINIVGFMITSMLCGLATSLPEIIAFRALQGVFGACLIPLSQFIMRDTFSKKELGMAMAVWAMGIMIAPILGPTLGGYITQNLNWRWVFFINVPVCIIAFMLTLDLIKESPTRKTPIDFVGLALLTLGVGSLQTFIEEGARDGWFESTFIKILAICAFFGITAFILRCLQAEHPLVKFHIFKNRQFISCSFIMLLFPMALFGMLTLQPLMLQTVMNYPPLDAGLIMAPRGLASLCLMPIVPFLMKKMDARFILALGFILVGLGTFLMTQWNLSVSFSHMAWESVIQGMGMAFVFSPLSALVFDDLPPQDIPGAAGMFSFSRSMGLSIGIAVFTTILTNQSQINWNRLGGHLTIFNPALKSWLSANHLSLNDPTTYPQLANLLSTHSNMIAYLDVFALSTVAFFLMIPFLFWIKKGRITHEIMEGAH